jgi:hypothetical protein
MILILPPSYINQTQPNQKELVEYYRRTSYVTSADWDNEVALTCFQNDG